MTTVINFACMHFPNDAFCWVYSAFNSNPLSLPDLLLGLRAVCTCMKGMQFNKTKGVEQEASPLEWTPRCAPEVDPPCLLQPQLCTGRQQTSDPLHTPARRTRFNSPIQIYDARCLNWCMWQCYMSFASSKMPFQWVHRPSTQAITMLEVLRSTHYT